MFTITGLTEDGREAFVSWTSPEVRGLVRSVSAWRGLEGDEGIVRLAISDEAAGQEFPATVTGPFLVADLDDARASLVQLGSYFRPGKRIEGDVPRVVYPVPGGSPKLVLIPGFAVAYDGPALPVYSARDQPRGRLAQRYSTTAKRFVKDAFKDPERNGSSEISTAAYPADPTAATMSRRPLAVSARGSSSGASSTRPSVP